MMIIHMVNSGLYALKNCYMWNSPVLNMSFHAHIQFHIAYGIGVYRGDFWSNIKKYLFYKINFIIIVSRKSPLHTGRILLHGNFGFYKILNNEMFVMKYFTERCKNTSIRV